MRFPTLIYTALLNRNFPWNPLLQQQFDRSHALFGHEAPDVDVRGYSIHNRREDHSLMVRHIGFHRHELLSARQARLREVKRIPEAVTTDGTQFSQSAKVFDRSAGLRAECKRRRIGRDDQIFGQPAPDAQTGNTECAVLIVVGGIRDPEGGFRDTPRHTALRRIRTLIVDGRYLALTQQCVAVAGKKDRRHQVFEHRSVPRQDGWLTLQTGDRAAEGVPVFDRNVVFRNGKETGEPRLGRQKVIVALIHLSDAVVIADKEQADLWVIKEFEVHSIGKRAASFPQVPNVLRQLLLPSGAFSHCLLKRIEPVGLARPGGALAQRIRYIGQAFVNGVQYLPD